MKFVLSVLELLRLIHAAGNDGTNIFSSSGCVRAEGDVSSMAEGFKSHLIRLIGNMCYRNKDNQDKVRVPLPEGRTDATSLTVPCLGLESVRCFAVKA